MVRMVPGYFPGMNVYSSYLNDRLDSYDIFIGGCLGTNESTISTGRWSVFLGIFFWFNW